MRLETPAECRHTYPQAARYHGLQVAIMTALRVLKAEYGPSHQVPEGEAVRRLSRVCMPYCERVMDERGRWLWPLDVMVLL